MTALTKSREQLQQERHDVDQPGYAVGDPAEHRGEGTRRQPSQRQSPIVIAGDANGIHAKKHHDGRQPPGLLSCPQLLCFGDVGSVSIVIDCSLED